MRKIKLIVNICLVFMLTAVSTAFYTSSVQAEENEWSKVTLPTEGEAGGWLVARAADTSLITCASDGTVYCYATPASSEYRLYKSENRGLTWTQIGDVEEEIVDIQTVADNPDMIFYATAEAVYGSTDGGETFDLIADDPSEEDNYNTVITSFDVTVVDGEIIVVIGTASKNRSENGSVYILREDDRYDWDEESMGNVDVYCVAFSPYYEDDEQIVAVACFDDYTVISTTIDRNGWNIDVGDYEIADCSTRRATISFPGDYDSDYKSGNYVQYITLDTGEGQGGAFKLTARRTSGSTSLEEFEFAWVFGDELDAASMAVSGDADSAFIIVGATNMPYVFYSKDGGDSWYYSDEAPSGDEYAYVALSYDFEDDGIAYVSTSGTESAVSISTDSCLSWNQAGLIDTRILKIKDLAISPDYAKDNTMLLLTRQVQESLWKTTDNGKHWQRIFVSTADPAFTLNFIKYSDSGNIYLGGTYSTSNQDKPAIWKSTDEGEFFTKLPGSTTFDYELVTISAWAISTDEDVFVASYNGTYGVIYRTVNGEMPYVYRAKAGEKSLNNIELSPNFKEDQTILVGNSYGEIYISTDGGYNFKSILNDGDEDPPLSGNVYAIFDPDYENNHIIYAASKDYSNGGIYRYTVGKSTKWESIDTTIPTKSAVNSIAATEDGTLYGMAYTQSSGVYASELERSLNPTYSLTPGFESVYRGIEGGESLNGIWTSGNTLWSIDTTNNVLFTYTDTITSAIELESPEDGVSGQSMSKITLSWDSISGASTYEWQVDTDDSFSNVSEDLQGTTSSSSVTLPTLESDNTYYWRVRVSSPAHSPWSEEWSFTTRLATTVVAPELTEPTATTAAAVQPKFVWTTMDGATGYELLVAKDNAFTDIVIDRTGDNALASNAWKSDVTLDYETTYYWKVRAVTDGNSSAWSAAGIFETESKSGASTATTTVQSTTTATTTVSPTATTPGEETGGSKTWIIFLVVGIVVAAGIGVGIFLRKRAIRS